jgi:hypothetical protein
MSLRARLRAWFVRRPQAAQAQRPCSGRRILVVVEGPHDIEFLKRISTVLRGHEPSLPDLATMERQGELVFVPFGGGDLWLWANRLAALDLPEFHLYDRESSPETELRQKVADVVNLRPRCQAVLTHKRALENYLHPSAIREVSGVDLEFADDDNVAELIAQRLYGEADETAWAELPRRGRTRRTNRVKKWLHTKAVDRMTPARLAERDPEGEVISWLTTITRLADETR